MHAKTGAVLSMANYPGYDPNRYQRYSRERQLNYAVTAGYEPGSTFKMITVAAGLNEGLISADQEFFCEEGEYKIGNNLIRDSSPQGVLTLEQVLKKSSNICAAKIGMSIPPSRFYDYIMLFGFGQSQIQELSLKHPEGLFLPKNGKALIMQRFLLVRPYLFRHCKW